MVPKTTRPRHFGLKVGVTEHKPYALKQIFPGVTEVHRV